MYIWKLDSEIFRISDLQMQKRISAFIIDKTVIQIENQDVSLLIAIEPIHKSAINQLIY